MKTSARIATLRLRRVFYIRILIILGSISFSGLFGCGSQSSKLAAQSADNSSDSLQARSDEPWLRKQDSIRKADSVRNATPYVNPHAICEYGIPQNVYEPVDGPKKYGVRRPDDD